MTSSAFDRCVVVVAGLGAMGSAIASELARSGSRVVGIDPQAPPHALGSTHGGSRIIREAYFEHPLYVPLVQRAFDAWRSLEARTGRSLLRSTGGLMIGPRDGEVVAGAIASAEAHGLPYEEVTAAEARRRWPLRVPDGTAVVFEPRAGILDPEACVAAYLELARHDGAEIRTGERLVAWESLAEGVRVRTDRDVIACDALVLAAGPWMPALLADLDLPLVVERVVQHWFRPLDAAAVAPERLPIFIWENSPARAWYGFPDTGAGVKVALHHQGAPSDPETVRREVASAEVEGMAELLRRWLPEAAGESLGSAVCLYTNTPDDHFLIDRHPADPRVHVVSPCSGHGFKFASAIGEVVAAEIAGHDPGFDLAPFRMARLRR